MLRRTELQRFKPLSAGTGELRRTELARKTGIKPGTKRLRQSRSTDKATPEQAARWERMRALGCLCCRLALLLGFKPTGMALEHHHLTDCGRRIGHDATIELCRYHHQGDAFPLIEAGYKANALVYGPSYGKDKPGFRAAYGTDAELLEFQDALIAQVEGVI